MRACFVGVIRVSCNDDFGVLMFYEPLLDNDKSGFHSTELHGWTWVRSIPIESNL
jgi:hypothetical protein